MSPVASSDESEDLPEPTESEPGISGSWWSVSTQKSQNHGLSGLLSIPGFSSWETEAWVRKSLTW